MNRDFIEMRDTQSTAQSLPRRLRRSIILYTGLGLLLTGSIIAGTILYPMYQQLMQYADLELEREVQSHALTIDQYLSRLTDTVRQITSRTRIRDLLVEYNQGLVSREELVAFSHPKLADALKLADDDVGMTRLDAAGNVAIEVGDAPSWGSLGLVPEDLHKPLLRGPVLTPAGPRLMVAAPIHDRPGQRVGTDLVAFSMAGLSRILQELNETDQTDQVQLAMQIDGRFHLLVANKNGGALEQAASPQSVHGRAMRELADKEEGVTLTIHDDSHTETHDEVTSLVLINSLDWVLSVSMSPSELYAIPNGLVGTLLPVITVLVLLGALGAVLLLNPLADKVIVQAEEYEKDIQQHTMALADLETAHSRIDNIIKSAPNGLLVCDAGYQVILANQVVAKLFEFDAEAVVGRSLKELIGEGVLPERINGLEPLARAQPAEVEFSLKQTDHSERFIRASYSAMQSSAGEFNGMIIVLQDVTRDRELDRMKNEFISTAAHELQTPLTALLGYTDMLIDPHLECGFSDEQKMEFMEEIYTKGEVLSLMVNDLLDISRIETGQPLPLRREVCDLLAIVRKVTDQFAMANESHRFVTELVPPPVGCRFQLDSGRINQVMENLLSNAVKYSPPGSKINVGGKALKHAYQVTVSDQGIGITAEQLPRVFDKFYRVDTSNTAIGGLGLGLSVVQQIINGHNGEIHLESAPEKGTKALFTVPMES